MRTLEPRKILVIAAPGLGDVFLATPLIRTLRSRYRTAQIDVLAGAGTGSMVEGNPDINNVIEFDSKPRRRSYFYLFKRIGRQYDLAVSTSSSDRSFGNALLAAKSCAAVVPALRITDWWKHLLCRKKVIESEDTHVVLQNLKLADVLGLDRVYSLVLPQITEPGLQKIRAFPSFDISRSFAVVHMMPGRNYKLLPQLVWEKIVNYLLDSGLDVALIGANSARDIEVGDRMLTRIPRAVNLVGKLNMAEVAALINQSQGFVGNDTSTSHLSAATGRPTVVLYGPSNVIKWSPWPIGYKQDTPPFRRQAGIQKVNNVTVAIADCRCWPFNRACRYSNNQQSRCLNNFDPELAIEAIKTSILVESLPAQQSRSSS